VISGLRRCEHEIPSVLGFYAV